MDSVSATAHVRRGDRQSNGNIRYRIQWTVEMEAGQLVQFEIPNALDYRDYSVRHRQSPWACSGLNSGQPAEVRQQTNLPTFGTSVDGVLHNQSTGRRTCRFTLYQDSRGNGPSADAFPISMVTYERLIPPGATASDLLESLAGKVGPGALGIRYENWVYTHPGDGEEAYLFRAPVHELLGAFSDGEALHLACVRNRPCWRGEQGETGASMQTEGPVAGEELDLVSGRIAEVRRRVLNDHLAPGSDNLDVHVSALNANLDRFSKTRYTLDADADGWWIEPDGLREEASRAPLGSLQLSTSEKRVTLRCMEGSACIRPPSGSPTSELILHLYDDAPLATIRERFQDMERLAPTSREAAPQPRAADPDIDHLLDEIRQQAEANSAEAREELARREAEVADDTVEPVAPAEPLQWHTVDGAMDGTETEFNLTSDRTGPAVPYELELQAGTVLHVRLAASGFDPFLTLYSPDGIVASNDDLGLGLDAGFRYEVPETAQYVLLAGATLAGATGSFTLRLRTE